MLKHSEFLPSNGCILCIPGHPKLTVNSIQEWSYPQDVNFELWLPSGQLSAAVNYSLAVFSDTFPWENGRSTYILPWYCPKRFRRYPCRPCWINSRHNQWVYQVQAERRRGLRRGGQTCVESSDWRGTCRSKFGYKEISGCANRAASWG